MDLTTATPVEIDTVLAGLYDVAATLRSDSTRAAQSVFSYANVRPTGSKVAYYDRNPKPEATLEEAIALIARREGVERYYVDQADAAVARLTVARAAIAANQAEQAPLHAEYKRRPWTRAYLVLSSNGHVHSSMDCSTCFYSRYDERSGEYKPGTQYGWLPRLSGHDEAEIVAAAGADACTICYPSAPVESLSRPRTVLHHTEEAAAVVRAQKAAEKVERDAKKAAKTLSPPVEVFDWTVPERHLQQRDGSIVVEPARDRYETLETVHAAKAWLTDSQEGYRPKRQEDVTRVAEALAAKFDTTPEDEILAAKKRAAKRR